MSRFIDLTGNVYGKLKVVSFAGRIEGHSYWDCVCECGNSKIVEAYKLKTGNTSSCGCFQKESRHFHTRTHGKTNCPEHKVWFGMKQRCYNPKNPNYVNYGGRGIKICDRWLGENGFMNFMEDMGPRPSKNHTIERDEVNGIYEPSNCRWLLKELQAINKRNNRFITFNGETKHISEWSRGVNGGHSVVGKRLKNGWPLDLALTLPAENKPLASRLTA